MRGRGKARRVDVEPEHLSATVLTAWSSYGVCACGQSVWSEHEATITGASL